MSGFTDIVRVDRVSFESVNYTTFSRQVKTKAMKRGEAIASVTASIARRGESDRFRCRLTKDFNFVAKSEGKSRNRFVAARTVLQILAHQIF